jgi:hypothetical protein
MVSCESPALFTGLATGEPEAVIRETPGLGKAVDLISIVIVRGVSSTNWYKSKYERPINGSFAPRNPDIVCPGLIEGMEENT